MKEISGAGVRPTRVASSTLLTRQFLDFVPFLFRGGTVFVNDNMFLICQSTAVSALFQELWEAKFGKVNFTSSIHGKFPCFPQRTSHCSFISSLGIGVLNCAKWAQIERLNSLIQRYVLGDFALRGLRFSQELYSKTKNSKLACPCLKHGIYC